VSNIVTSVGGGNGTLQSDPKQLEYEIVAVDCGDAGPPAALSALDLIPMGSGRGKSFFWMKNGDVGSRVKAAIDELGAQTTTIAIEV
jgi:hypothetical protein